METNKYRPRHSLAVIGGLLLIVPMVLLMVDMRLSSATLMAAFLQVTAIILLIIYGVQWTVTLALYVKQAGKE